jgi:RecA-family ATPase
MILPKIDPYLDSQRLAVRIGRLAPMHFCTFAVTPEGRKTPYKKSGMGVARDTPQEQLYTSDDIEFMDEPPHGQYLGLVMQSPIPVGDKLLICIDVDMKHSTSPTSTAIQRMARWAKETNALVETSVSMKGKHIFILANTTDLDKVLPKYKLGGGQEVEIFGHAKAAGKSVLLSGVKVQGEIGTDKSYNLHQLLTDWGVIDQHTANQPVPITTPTKPFDFTALVPDDEFAKASQALQHIDPDITYDEWIAIGQALHTAFGHQGHGLWAQWSSNGSKYAGDKDIDSHWKSFSADKGVSIGTLFHIAKAHGYRPPTRSDVRRSAVEDFTSFIQAGQEIQQLSAAQVDQTVDRTADQTVQPAHWPEINLDLTTLKPTRYLIDNFWGHGFMVLAGQPGLGKTNAVLSLSMVMAGFTLSDSPLKAKRPRKTIIVTEDSSQVIDTLYAYKKHFNLQDIQDWIVVIDAKRSDVKDLLQLSTNVLNHTINGIRPHLILDTANSTMDLENENDNSEVGSFMAALKQTIYHQLDTPITIITHTPKTINRQDADAMARGASAFTGDATQTSVLFIDDDKTRYLRLAKLRYEPKFREVRFESHVFPEMTIDQDGDPQEKLLRVAIPYESSETDRESLQQERQSEAVQQRAMDKADEACAYVQSVINAHPEGVVIRRGSHGPKNPSNTTAYRLEWSEIFAAIPGSTRGDVRKAVGAAIFQRFNPTAANNQWVELRDQ